MTIASHSARRGVAGRRLEAVEDRLQPLGRDVLDVGLAAPQLGDPLRIHVDADDVLAGFGELDRQGQSDVPQSEDADGFQGLLLAVVDARAALPGGRSVGAHAASPSAGERRSRCRRNCSRTSLHVLRSISARWRKARAHEVWPSDPASHS